MVSFYEEVVIVCSLLLFSPVNGLVSAVVRVMAEKIGRVVLKMEEVVPLPSVSVVLLVNHERMQQQPIHYVHDLQ